MSQAARQWSWSQPAVLASISSRASLMAAARQRQATLMREWEASKPQRLASAERILAEAPPAPAAEQQAERVLATATLGQLLQPHSGLGQQRRSPRAGQSVEEQHAQLHARLLHAAAAPL